MTDWEARCRRLEAENAALRTAITNYVLWSSEEGRLTDSQAERALREALAVSTPDEKEDE